MKESEEGTGLFAALDDQPIPVSVVLLGEVLSPFLVPLFLLDGLLFELFKSILSFLFLIACPLGFYFAVEAFILIFPLFFHLDQPYDPFLCCQEICLIDSLLQQRFSFDMKWWVKLLNGPSSWVLARGVPFITVYCAFKGALIDEVFLLPFHESPQFLSQIRVHILLVSVIKFALNEGNGS